MKKVVMLMMALALTATTVTSCGSDDDETTEQVSKSNIVGKWRADRGNSRATIFDIKDDYISVSAIDEWGEELNNGMFDYTFDGSTLRMKRRGSIHSTWGENPTFTIAFSGNDTMHILFSGESQNVSMTFHRVK